MKRCDHCGAKNEDGEANCLKCKEPFVPGFDPSPDNVKGRIRPDGDNMVVYGGIALVLGLIALALGWLLPVSDYSFGDIDPGRLQLKSNLMAFGAVLTNLGALSYFAGKIIDAISFLPGKED